MDRTKTNVLFASNLAEAKELRLLWEIWAKDAKARPWANVLQRRNKPRHKSSKQPVK